MFFSWLRNRRRRKLLAQPFAADWEELLAARFWPYRRLPEPIAARLRDRLQIFLAERTFTGCGGLELNEEMRLLTAAQACLLIAGDVGDFCFERLPDLLLYPAPYVTPDDDDGPGEERLGEAWHRGPIVLSWPDVRAGAASPNQGRNLVMHEFAHHLDGLDGEVGGAPPMPSRQAQQRWNEVATRELAELRRALETGRPTLLDPYAATNPAEFFAVATEHFFQEPRPLARRHADLYELLAGFYRLDPRDWAPGGKSEGVPAESLLRAPPSEEALGDDSHTEDSSIAEEAEAWISAAELDRESPDAAFTRGEALLDAGRFEEAELCFTRALEGDPHDGEALHRRALARLALRRFAEAHEDCRRALALDPDDLAPLLVQAQVNLARGRFEEAIHDATHVLWRQPRDIDAAATRGLARLELADFAGALADLNLALDQDPEDIELLLARAETLEQLGRLDQAELDRRRAALLDLEERDMGDP